MTASGAPASRIRAPGKRLSRRARDRYDRREVIAAYAFLSPWLVGFLVFTVGAMVFSLVVSFSRYNIAANTIRPVGLANYLALGSDPKVPLALANTLYYAVLAVPLEIAFALFLAMVLNRVGPGSGLFRTIFYLPKMTPAVATASVFLLLLNGNRGAINKGLALIGIQGPEWLVDPAWIKPSIVLMTLWGVSGTMVILLAALRNVPVELHEAAALDGAGAVRRFFWVTLPMISGAVFFNVVVLTIAALQIFDQAYLLFYRDQVSAAPDASLFYAVYLFQQAFRQFDFGFASAMAWLIFVIILAISLIQVKVGNRLVFYENEERP